jgi:hypothetical protein
LFQGKLQGDRKGLFQRPLFTITEAYVHYFCLELTKSTASVA